MRIDYRNFLTGLLIFAVLNTSGCSTLGYYAQSVHGQMQILLKRSSIHKYVKKEIPSALRGDLLQALQIREFASEELLLPRNDSYLSYVDLGRDYVVWNVIATPEFSLEPVTSCYLVVGCLSYRGYFHKKAALGHATQLRHQGNDVFVGGVAAYSTLGWFDDPVMNTMLNGDNTYLATVIFHELAHQKIYIRDDTPFNEAFAESVAVIGVREWLRREGNLPELTRFEQSEQNADRFLSLVKYYHERLTQLYQSDMTERSMREAKTDLLQQMHQDYVQISRDWGADSGYGFLFEGGMNNAKLAAIHTYRDIMPYFISLYESVGKDLMLFYLRVEQLSQCPYAERWQTISEQHYTISCHINSIHSDLSGRTRQ